MMLEDNSMKTIVYVIVMFLITPVFGVSAYQELNNSQKLSPSLSEDILFVGGSGPNNYTSIQSAIDDANDGDTVYVYNDSSPYLEQITIYKEIKLIGEDKETTVVEYGGSHVITLQKNNIVVSNLYITGDATRGVVFESNGNIINNNIFRGNYFSLYDYDGANSNIITNNIILSGYMWINGYDYIITNNTCFHSGINIQSVGHTIENNTNNGKPILFLKNIQDLKVTDDPGQIILFNCENITIQDKVITDTYTAIYLRNSHNCLIDNNTLQGNRGYDLSLIQSYSNYITKNIVGTSYDGSIRISSSDNNYIISNSISSEYEGILLSGSNNLIHNNVFESGDYSSAISLWGAINNTISCNTIVSTQTYYEYGYGQISLYGDCLYNKIINNTITTDYTENVDGITLDEYCKYNILSGNIINNFIAAIYLDSFCQFNLITNNNLYNNRDGIVLSTSKNNEIYHNHIVNNSDGIDLFDSNNNSIHHNTFENNNDIGLSLVLSRYNSITQNNFINNNQNADFSVLSWNNQWDSNYWDQSRTLPYFIFGHIGLGLLLPFSWINIDWRPAQEPYDL